MVIMFSTPIFFFPLGVTTHCGFVFTALSGLLASSFEVSRSHNDAPQSVGLLRKSDQLVAKTST